MQRAGQHLFTGAALTKQHHGGVCWRNFLDLATEFEHHRGGRNHPGQRILDSAGESTILALELGELECARDHHFERFRLNRLLIKIVGTESDSLDRNRVIVIPGDHDHFSLRGALKNLGQGLEALARVGGIRWQSQIQSNHHGFHSAQLGQC